MSKQIFTIFLAAAVFFSFSSAKAQAVYTADEALSDFYEEQAECSSQAELEAAQEYEDFIERLEKLAYDYQGYFSKFDEYHAIKYRALLQKLILKINKGKFCGDTERLRDEMDYIKEVLHKQQIEIKEEVGNIRLYRLSRKLQSELQMLIDELDEEIVLEMAEEISRESVIEYLKLGRQSSEEAKKIYAQTVIDHERLRKHIEEAVKIALEVQKGMLSEEQIKNMEELAELQEEMQSWSLDEIGPIVIVPPVPEIEMPENPDRVHPQPIPPSRKGPRFIIAPDQASAVMEYADSIKVPSTNIPIFINSQTGDLKVTGWYEDRVVVRFNVEISAEDEVSAENFAEGIEVKLSGNDKGIYLTTVFPALKDPKRQILHSSVDVRVPAENSLICENSFGTIKVANITGGLKLNSSYCEVFLNEIEGEIKAVSKMNQLSVSNSYGKMTLRNSMGNILVNDCEGNFDIENSYSPVRLTHCSGPAVVRNSGQIAVSDHDGTLSVENSNGLVEITDLIGDLNARNSYQALIVSDVLGSVEVQNISGTIKMSDVSGPALASNKFGTISGRYLTGPVDFDNEAGTTHLIIDKELQGPSFIVSNAGTVSLEFSNQANVALSVKTEHGKIIGARGNAIRKDGPISSTEMKFGRGETSLSVNTKSSTVVIEADKDI